MSTPKHMAQAKLELLARLATAIRESLANPDVDMPQFRAIVEAFRAQVSIADMIAIVLECSAGRLN